MVKLKDLLTEGVMDKGILKAVFLAGGPGSGKSFVASGLFGIPKKVNTSAYGLKLVNQDKELERMLKKYGFGLDLDDIESKLTKNQLLMLKREPKNKNDDKAILILTEDGQKLGYVGNMDHRPSRGGVRGDAAGQPRPARQPPATSCARKNAL